MKTICLSPVSLAILLTTLPAASDAQWVQTNAQLAGYTATSLVVGGTKLFAGTSGYGVMLSTNDGASWSFANIGLTNNVVLALEVSDTNIFAGTYGDGVFLSSNLGTSWVSANNGLTNADVSTLALSGRNVFAGTSGGVFLSTDNGASWSDVSTGLPIGHVHSLAVSHSILIAGTDSGAFRSTNYGEQWTAVGTGLKNIIVSSLAVLDSNLFAGTSDVRFLGGGVFRSTDGGINWNNAGLKSDYIYSLAVSGTNLFAGGANGVFISTNKGTSWSDVSAGLWSIAYVRSLVVSGTNLFAGTNGPGIWRRPLSEMITSVQFRTGNAPAVFSLEQNYPNPFNPSTTIRYAIPQRSHVTLTIFNILGQQVATLVQGQQEAGYHDVRFDASGLASGVYFYRLHAGEYIVTKRALLLK